MRLIIRILLTFFFVQSSLIARDIYVTINGDDASTGEKTAPVITLGKALELAAQKRDADTIYISNGLYDNTSVEITSKTRNLTIVGEGPETVLSGGISIEDWKRNGKYLVASVPGTTDREWDFRMLIVNGESRPRARLPETGAFTHGNDFEVRWLSSFAGGWERKPTHEELHVLKYLNDDIPEDLDVKNGEITIYHEWDETLVGLESHDAIAKTVTFTNKPGHPPGAFAERNDNAQTYVLWNVKEGMTRPGQWYLDRSNETIVYWPIEGEDANSIQVIAPKNPHVFDFKRGSSDVTIKNLCVTGTSTAMITGRYAALAFSGAINGEFKSDLTLEGVTLKNVTGWGIKVKGKGLTVQNTIVSHTGAGAICYSGKKNKVDDCEIHDVGLVYPSAVGILGRGEKNQVSNNHIFNMPYCGINNVGSKSLVEGNVIYNIKGFMQDGGAIYMINHKGTVVRNNAVFGNPDRRIPVYAYYLDERCEDCIVENNLAVETWVPVQAHMTRDCSYQNNLFIDSELQSMRYALSFDLSYVNNIHVAESIEFVGSTPEAHGVEMVETNKELQKYFVANGMVPRSGNIYASASGKVTQEKLVLYETFNTLPLESVDDIYGIPTFKSPETGDFSIVGEEFESEFDSEFIQKNPLILEYLDNILPELN